MLSERKKKILQAVIDENLVSAEPVSSKDIESRYGLGVSSATIRNELMALEEMGYLFQPHTSSGRLPTAVGYHKYVDELMEGVKLSPAEVDKLETELTSRITNMEELALKTAKVLSDATNYASVVCFGERDDAVISKVSLVKILEDTCLVILSTDLGVIKDITIKVNARVTEEDASAVAKLLTEALAGHTLKDASGFEVGYKIGKMLSGYREIFASVIEALKTRETKNFVRCEGASKLLCQPEFKSVEKAQKAIKLLESEETLQKLLNQNASSENGKMQISVKVSEDGLDENSALVSATFMVNGKTVGQAGIIGPARMDYAKVVTILKEAGYAFEKSYNKNNIALKGDDKLCEKREHSERNERQKGQFKNRKFESKNR